MDPNFNGFSGYTNGFKLEDDPSLKFNMPSPDLSFLETSFDSTQIVKTNGSAPSLMVSPSVDSFSVSTGWSPEGESSSPSDDSESSDPVLKYISQMLLEENMEEIPHMFHDPFVLHDTERSLYEVLGEQQPVMNQNWGESPDSNFSASGDHSSGSTSTLSWSREFVDPLWVDDHRTLPSPFHAPLSFEHFPTNMPQVSTDDSVHPTIQLNDNMGNGSVESSVSELLVQNILSNEESILQFKKGLEEGSKFLPTNNQLIIDLESETLDHGKKKDLRTVVKVEHNEWDDLLQDELRDRKHHEREDTDIQEERRSKQSAVYVEESELSEMFDKVLLCWNTENLRQCLKKTTDQYEESQLSGSRSRGRKQNRKKETVDLRSLLVLCSQAATSNDPRTAIELLKQIKEHASTLGDGCQRLAYFFANALEARLDGRGSGVQFFFASPDSQKTTAADVLKAYKVYLAICPFKKVAIAFANKTIYKMAQDVGTLHIVDFGIMYGFQWPILIQHLSTRAGGPPKLRITGIDIPMPGFRPLARIEETGHRLARYCEKFKVPFEYNPIASKNWESIKIEDLKIDSSEMLAVNCLYHFRTLLDETAEVECPRDAVLKLIRRMNPKIFVHSVVNGSYNAPFFSSRFREALFHYSALFDMLDATTHREEPGRLMFEREFYGRGIMNVVACEGVARFERPESYKQWQARTVRAGLKQLPLDLELLKILKNKLKAWYHKDFVMDEDKDWLLQGWKGRILYASSCWVPA